jgi:hypothetical protein
MIIGPNKRRKLVEVGWRITQDEDIRRKRRRNFEKGRKEKES